MAIPPFPFAAAPENILPGRDPAKGGRDEARVARERHILAGRRIRMQGLLSALRSDARVH